jgi:KaiC/GvpD/RAD55 family RecA-like ATPase
MSLELRELFEVHRISEEEISNMSDNLILLGYTRGPELVRTIRVLKTRGSGHDNRVHMLNIGNHGASVEDLG